MLLLAMSPLINKVPDVGNGNNEFVSTAETLPASKTRPSRLSKSRRMEAFVRCILFAALALLRRKRSIDVMERRNRLLVVDMGNTPWNICSLITKSFLTSQRNEVVDRSSVISDGFQSPTISSFTFVVSKSRNFCLNSCSAPNPASIPNLKSTRL